LPELWAGTDAGKAEHHCTVIDANGTKTLSRRVPNNEPELLDLIADVLALADGDPVTWAMLHGAGCQDEVVSGTGFPSAPSGPSYLTPTVGVCFGPSSAGPAGPPCGYGSSVLAGVAGAASRSGLGHHRRCPFSVQGSVD